ncbi:beta-glucosidase [Amycolatopsis antarctica]|uniref:beta-glucosidase n=1 Tax=Amycolatopsis antarctica TaxID=1854586 RepID=A0A263D0B0_9PSEU|nr:glycoside hydrolase family 3 N-terminal domain-containing protein [Amycolatopsis antarctica]OZM71791.1 beta-glucosidase [Amycolatopsis antarctica]
MTLPRRGPARGSRLTAIAGLLLAGSVIAPLGATAQTAPPPPPPYQDPDQPVPARVADLLGRMSVDDKIGQMVQGERASATPADAAGHRLGSVLSGGGSWPAPNTAESWADMYDAYQREAMDSPLGIPLIYGVDAVHGHNNVHGATIFPHNIGLGAANDAELTEDIARATAEEVAGTGIDWNFAPCLCVARDDRWGRTYESFGELPEDATRNAGVIDGLQGDALNGPASVMATAKHFIGDGGTTGGDDQGDTEVSEAELRRVHLPPFQEAIDRNVGSVMISYSSWNGEKLHGHEYLIDELLKQELGFSGIVISDYNAIDQIDGEEGFTAEEVRQSVNAGIDMFMVPEDYAKFIELLRAEVDAGRVSEARLDDANTRILTKKFELGLFERPLADRSYLQTVGSAEHRELARDAVRKSQVLLKNDGALPLAKDGGKIFVAGKNANDIGNQSGGWTITWQGESGPTTTGTTVLDGIREVAGESTEVAYDREAEGIDDSYGAAVVVVGETPYAEHEGDRPDDLRLDEEDLATLEKVRATGVPTVAVLVSGRPMDITEEVSGVDALLASWLPGSEGAGVADVLFGDHNPSGKLTFSWARDFEQQPINVGDGKDPLYGYGHGLSYPAS